MTCFQFKKKKRDKFLLRVAEPEFSELQQLVFIRYPNLEWATFAQFGWRVIDNTILITLADINRPTGRDLDLNVGHVSFDEQYTLRMALAAEKHALAVGVIHSHPEDCIPKPSIVDDDMDGYFSKYFQDFAPNRPYVSLILSKVRGRLLISGRVYWQDEWLTLEHIYAGATPERQPVLRWPHTRHKKHPKYEIDRVKRFANAFGEEAYYRLRDSSVAVIGAGGTGSAVIEILARAGLGRLVVIDPDRVDRSNLERIRGSIPSHAKKKTPKVVVAQELVHQIDPSIEVIAIMGRLPQSEVIDAVVTSDIVLGCTDKQHSRLALSDIAYRYLVPAMDCGVTLEGSNGQITGQVAQFVRFLPSDPCVLCRKMINPRQVAQELMSPNERASRKAAAEHAQAQGNDPGPYWLDEPQIDTVGYLTSSVGAMLAGYAIGWLTQRYDPPFERMQMNFVARFLDITDQKENQRLECTCAMFKGWADQAEADSLVSPPLHWPNATLIRKKTIFNRRKFR